MKVFIITDLEGVSGVYNMEQQCIPGGRGYDEARKLLTAEVNAAVDGFLAAGAKQVDVLDGHGYPGLSFPDLHPEARAILGDPMPLGWGLDDTYNAAALVGYHARAGTISGVLDHTMSSKTILNFWLNGHVVGEIGWCAAMAGHFDVPIILVTGDRSAVDEARSLLDDVEIVAVKEGISRSAAICVSPAKAQRLIRDAAQRALARLAAFRPYRPSPPFELRVEFVNSAFALEATLRSRSAERIDARTVVYRSDNILDVLWRR